MIYLQLFICFIKIGFTSFGGLSMIPLISDEVLSHGWMTQTELTDIVAIAEMTPGPIALNCASFAGMKSAGLLGAVVANLGVLVPTFTLCLIFAVFYEKVKNSRIMEKILTGVRPACVGLIFAVVVSLGETNYFPRAKLDITAVIIGIGSLFLIMKLKWNVPKIIGCSALMGILLHCL